MKSCPFCGARFAVNYKSGPSWVCCTISPTDDPGSRAYQTNGCLRGERDRLLIQLAQAAQEIQALRTANTELMRRTTAGGAN